jgi:hypothetical protein
LKFAIIYEAAGLFLGVVETVSVRSVGGDEETEEGRGREGRFSAAFLREKL